MTGFFKQKLSTPRAAIPTDSSAKVEVFNSANEKHFAVINARVARFKEALSEMRTIDKGIFLGAWMSGVCFGVNMIPLMPYIPFTFTLAITGAAILSYSLGCRSQFYDKYMKTYNDLKEVYQWSLGSRTDDYWYAIREKPVQEMILGLGPWVPKEFITTWREEDFTESLIPQVFRERAPMRKITELPKEFIAKLVDLSSGVTQAANKEYRYYGDNNFGDYSTIAEEYWGFAKTLPNRANDTASSAGEIATTLAALTKPHNS